MFDLDRFKAINDAHGHAAGDAVIEGFGRLLRDHAPPGAIVARLGGEEFALLIEGATSSTLWPYAHALRAALAGEGAMPTLSGGIAERHGGESLSDLLRRADQACYAAKNGGRDRLCLAPVPGGEALVSFAQVA